MDKQTNEILVEVSKQIAKDTYKDGAKPIIKPTGQAVGLLPRAIKAALLPLEKWILEREYNLEETRKLLEIKLQKVSPELIESPEPYIAVPSLQYISYCMDSEELRNMYANILANSMNKVVKNEVHPGFVEIIKQLSPDEAKILRCLSKIHEVPIIGVRYKKQSDGGINIVGKFSNIGELAKCENPYDIEKYFDNLERLGLIYSSKESYYTNENKYKELKEHKEIKKLEKIPEIFIQQGYIKMDFEKGISKLTRYGEVFCKICVMDKE